jgi:hypothetical protein
MFILYCETIHTMKGQSTNWFPEILKLKFNAYAFETLNTILTFPATAFESLLKTYKWYFDSVLLKTEFSVIYSTEEFLQNNIQTSSNIWLSQIWVWHYQKSKSNLPVITIPTTGVSVKRLFFALSMQHTDSGETR